MEASLGADSREVLHHEPIEGYILVLVLAPHSNKVAAKILKWNFPKVNSKKNRGK